MARNAQATMADQLADPRELEAARQPEYRPTKRSSARKFYFRADHGHRQPMIRIPGVVEDMADEKVHAFYTRRYEKKYTPEQRAMHAAAREANNGEWFITFSRVPNRFESFLETDSDVLADYIRVLIASGDLPFVYEDQRLPENDELNTMPIHRAAAALRVEKAKKQAKDAA